MDLSKYQPVWAPVAEINTENKTFQFREKIGPGSIAGLVKSLADEGQKFPVVLLQGADHEESSARRFQLISGFRRVAAARSLNWEKVLAIIIPQSDMSEEEALRLNFIENVERKTLTGLDIMFACRKLSGQGKSNVEIGRLIGKSEAQVRRYLKVADAPADVQARVASGETTIKEAANEQLVPGDEAAAQNKNMYVKSTKNGFTATLKFDRKHDDPGQAIQFANSLIKLIKAESKKKGQGAGVKGQTAGAESIASGDVSRRDGWQNLQDTGSADAGLEGAAAGLSESFKFVGREMLEQYKAMLESGNTAIIESMLKEQGMTVEQFRAQIDEALKNLS